MTKKNSSRTGLAKSTKAKVYQSSDQSVRVDTKQKSLEIFKEDIRKYHKEADKSFSPFAANSIRCGLTLLDAKNLVGHGSFKEWIDNNFANGHGPTIRTCQRYMVAAKKFRDFVQSRQIQQDANASLVSLLDNSEFLADFLENTEKLPAKGTEQPAAFIWEIPSEIISRARDALASLGEIPESIETQVIYPAKSKTTDESESHFNVIGTHLFVIAPGADVEQPLKGIQDSISRGDSTAAVVILPSGFEPSILSVLQQSPICLLRDRMRICQVCQGKRVDKVLKQPMAVVLMSAKREASLFAECFGELGPVYMPCNKPALPAITSESQPKLN